MTTAKKEMVVARPRGLRVVDLDEPWMSKLAVPHLEEATVNRRSVACLSLGKWTWFWAVAEVAQSSLLRYSAAMTVLALKLLLAPLLVVASSLAGRRWGPKVAGILVVLPIVAGPILLILYLDHGRSFAADAARAATLGIVPLSAFALIFAYLSRRQGWLLILLTSWITVLVADFALSHLAVSAGVALLLALLALHGAGT